PSPARFAAQGRCASVSNELLEGCLRTDSLQKLRLQRLQFSVHVVRRLVRFSIDFAVYHIELAIPRIRGSINKDLSLFVAQHGTVLCHEVNETGFYLCKILCDVVASL